MSISIPLARLCKISNQNNWILRQIHCDIMFSNSFTKRRQYNLAYVVMLEINTGYLYVQQLFGVVFDVDEEYDFVNLENHNEQSQFDKSNSTQNH